MNDDRPLLRAIAANPDDAPRLGPADRFDGHDEPKLAARLCSACADPLSVVLLVATDGD